MWTSCRAAVPCCALMMVMLAAEEAKVVSHVHPQVCAGTVDMT